MASEIKIPIVLWAHRSSNAHGRWTHLDMADSGHTPKGWLLAYDVAVDLNGGLAEPVPTYVHATPAAKVRIQWTTASTDTSNAIRLHLFAKHLTPNTDVFNKTWDDSALVIDDTSNGQYKLNEVDISLVSALPAAGRDLRFVLRRNKPGIPQDALAAHIYLVNAWLMMDKAT